MEETSRQHNVESVEWLLLITLTWVTMKKSSEEEEMQNVQFGRKKSIRKLKVTAKSYAEGEP